MKLVDIGYQKKSMETVSFVNVCFFGYPSSSLLVFSSWLSYIAGKSYKFKYQNREIEVEVNSFLCPSFTVFVDGAEAKTQTHKRTYWLRLFIVMLLCGWALFGVAAATLVVLASVVDQWMHIWRQIYWILALLTLIGGYFAIVGSVGFVRALFLPRKARSPAAAQQAQQA